MATFAHDPTRVHPPQGFPPVPSGSTLPLAVPAPDTRLVPDGPQTHNTYDDGGSGRTLVSVALGGFGEPHRLVYIMTARDVRNQGLARAALTGVLADIDADGRAMEVYIRNTDRDCDVPRLITFLESLGFVATTLDPADPAPQLLRPAAAPAK